MVVGSCVCSDGVASSCSTMGGTGYGEKTLLPMINQATSFPPRHAISRAYFFLNLAECCDIQTRDHCEAFMEAAIVFARTAIHRLQSQFKHHPDWKKWFAALLNDSAVMFFRQERDHILKVGPPKVGQVIGGAPQRAAEMYYYENFDIPATVTLRRHLDAVTETVKEAEQKFTQP